MILKLYSFAILVLDTVSCIVRFIFILLESLFRVVLPPREKSLIGEVVLVTGAGHGIGKQLALQFASLGSVVVCLDINQPENERTVEEIKEAGGRAYCFKCDVSNRNEVLQVAKQMESCCGDVTMIVNNAGIMPCHNLLAHNSQEIQRTFEINVLSHFWVLEAFLPKMIERNHGHVVAISSGAGLCGTPNLVPYSASKYAVRGLMEALSEELRQDCRKLDIKFTCVFPFLVDTGLVQNPKLRFPKLLGAVSAEEGARQIIAAVRRNYKEISIPSFLLPMYKFIRVFPHKTLELTVDYMDSTMNSHE